ncbi:hypothetical protein KAU19_06950, partial [Candidatus Parcubacteria bacterium]|nr:hypothetical protein [Candidatus Parcubacteria bacterium]
MDYGITQNPNSFLTINIDQWLIYLFVLAMVLSALIIAKIIIRKRAAKNQYYNHVVYLVRLPKEKPEDQQPESNRLQKLHEEIACGEIVFNAIGGLRAQRGFKQWLLGRNDHFSFEIVANEKLVSFYVVTARPMARYIEQQVQAHYPEAVMEEVEDYNIFNPQGEIAAGHLKTRREFIFPIKTYKKQETDPMNSIINVMSKLDKNEGMAIQYIVRSAKAGWHRKPSQVVREVHQGKPLNEALKTSGFSKAMAGLGSL